MRERPASAGLLVLPVRTASPGGFGTEQGVLHWANRSANRSALYGPRSHSRSVPLTRSPTKAWGQVLHSNTTGRLFGDTRRRICVVKARSDGDFAQLRRLQMLQRKT
jgi:hypothetical protein